MTEERLNGLWLVVVALTAFAACGPKVVEVAPDERAVYQTGDEGIDLPSPLETVDPKYTEEAIDAKVTGEVWLKVVVLPDGTVGDVTLTKSLDTRYGLDEEALKAARLWRWAPGTRLGEPVSVQVAIAVAFELR